MPPATETPLTIDEAVARIRPRDSVATGLVGGQAGALLDALGRRDDLEEVVVYTGLLDRPSAMLQNPAIVLMSGFFGPIERAARADGARIEYVAADFHGLERMALELKPRVVLAVTTLPDTDGWMSFGIHAGANYRPFVEAAADPARLAIAQANPVLPRVGGLPEFGGHRVHVSEIDGWVLHEEPLLPLAGAPPSEEELTIARQCDELIGSGSTLQFGIGGIPDEIARALAAGPDEDLGIHTEMLSDGVMHLHRAGKVTNQKGLYDGVTIATFALGSAELYAWMDGNPDVRMLPVGAVNEPALLRELRSFVSINGALAVDLRGQVAADHVGGRQYSGIGGHHSFVQGAREAPGGMSLLCFKSTAEVQGTRVSTIVPRLPAQMTVTTPRHHVHWVVTEFGHADLSVLGDRGRAAALAELAHPDFRDELRAAAAV